MKKNLGIFIVLLFFSLLGWQIYEKLSASVERSGGRGRQAVPVAVEVMPIRKVGIRDVGYFTGSLYPQSQFIVAPKVGGRLERLFSNIGERVVKGQLIAVMEDDEYLQQVGEARAELDVARAKVEETRSTLNIASREFERAKELRNKKIASVSDLEAAEAQFKTQNAMYKVATAQVAQKAAALKASEVRLSYTQIHASWESGSEHRIVGERFVDEGAMLSPNGSIVSILDIGTLTAVIYVIERDYPKVSKGQKAIVTTDAYPGRSFSGNVVRVAPLLKETSREARVEIEVPNQDDLLKPGMFVRIQIEFKKHDDATVVPLAALIRSGTQQGVFLVDPQNREARFVPVTAGIIDNDLVEILTPSLSGFVVTLGQHLLEDGSAVILPEEKGQEDRPKGPTGAAGSDRMGKTGSRGSP